MTYSHHSLSSQNALILPPRPEGHLVSYIYAVYTVGEFYIHANGDDLSTKICHLFEIKFFLNYKLCGPSSIS